MLSYTHPLARTLLTSQHFKSTPGRLSAGDLSNTPCQPLSPRKTFNLVEQVIFRLYAYPLGSPTTEVVARGLAEVLVTIGKLVTVGVVPAGDVRTASPRDPLRTSLSVAGAAVDALA